MTIAYKHFSEKISVLLSNKLKTAMERRGLSDYAIIQNWKQIAGEELGSKCIPGRFVRKDKTFYVYSKDLEFRAYFKYNKNLLLERLQVFFGINAVNTVRLIS